ncbi:MAG: Helix-turn-helix domain protein [Syntrophorhabdus sp. PtaU1.Bin153]|nr:MAG: Helix-turn-helix domain protein [Syntrophorhabdus sp. PtaU1.Bin153]
MEKLITVNEALDILRISRPTIYRFIADGSLKPVKIGKRTLFEEKELQRFIDSRSGKKE